MVPVRHTAALLLTFGAACLTQSAWGQVRKLHTRDLTRLSQVQVVDYLKRSDVIFIPIGAVETNGILPSDRDYVYALGYAMAMAEQTDSLFLPGLVWSYPGTTMVAPSTINITPTESVAFLRATAKSLLKQGFRRQVYVSSSHGPAPLTGGTLAREFFDQEHVPILYIDMDRYLPRLKLPADARSKTIYGSHLIAGRLVDIPLKTDYGAAESHAAKPIPENEGLAELGKLGFSGSLSLGSWIPDAMAHAGAGTPLASNSAERDAWGQEGKEQVMSIVRQMELPKALESLRKHDEFTNRILIPKYGGILPNSR